MALRGVAAVAARLLAPVDLEDSAEVILQKLSRGMLLRVGFAQAMLNSPAVPGAL